MNQEIHSLTEADRDDLAGSSKVLDFIRPEKGDALQLGDILASMVLPDLAVRMRGNFNLPKVVVSAEREDTRRRP